MASDASVVDFGDLVLDDAGSSLFAMDGDLYLERESRIRSGEYPATLATELENIIKTSSDEPLRKAVQDIIDELSYVQEYYELTRKPRSSLPNARQ